MVSKDTSSISPSLYPPLPRSRCQSIPSKFRRKTSLSCMLTFTLLLTLQPSQTWAYITSHQAVPVRRQMKWLKEIASELTSTKPGQLSKDQLSAAPDVLYALSHSRKSTTETALLLESVVKRLVDEQRAGNAAASELTVNDYNDLLETWARSGGGVAAAERCEQIVTAMQEQASANSASLLQPNLTSFKAVLTAWRQAVQQDESCLSFAPFRMQRILEWMIRLSVPSNSDKTTTTGNLVATNLSAFPDADCFDMCLQTWSRSGHDKAPQQTERLLVTMERLWERTGQPVVRPRTSSFNAVLAAWARSAAQSPPAADRAASILAFMEQLRKHDATAPSCPDVVSYCTVLTALSKQQAALATTTTSSQTKKQEIMEATYQAAVKATTFLHHAVDINVYQLQKQAQQQQKQQGQTHGDNVLSSGKQPLSLDTILFNTAMGLWCKVSTPGAYRQAAAILDIQRNIYCGTYLPRNNNNSRQKRGTAKETTDSDGDMDGSDYYYEACRPDVFSYTSVLTTCASESSPREFANAWKVAKATYEQFLVESSSALLSDTDDKNNRPVIPLVANHVTYGTMLKACARLVRPDDPERLLWARRIWTHAVASGQVGPMVVRHLERALSGQSKSVFRNEFLQGHSPRKLPAEWTRRVDTPTARSGSYYQQHNNMMNHHGHTTNKPYQQYHSRRNYVRQEGGKRNRQKQGDV